MNAERPETAVARIAAAIGEPARVRILYCLLDGQARTSTELSVVAEVSPSTTSVHLHRLLAEGLVKAFIEGKHHYYSLEGAEVAAALEALQLVVGRRHRLFSSTPARLLLARTCYDHLAGRLGVLLHNHLKAKGWLLARATGSEDAYEVTPEGAHAFQALGIDLVSTRKQRRRLAYPCLDWSEREPHLGGALGAALLNIALKRKWVIRDLDSRALTITGHGRREMLARLGLRL